MHTGRLHAVLRLVADDYRAFNAPERLNEYINCMHQVGAREDARSALLILLRVAVLKKALTSGAMASLTPSQERILAETGSLHRTGRGLWSRIETSIRDLRSYPLALERDLRSLLDDTVRFHATVFALLSGFKELSVECTQIDEHESEIGVILPADVFKPTMEGLEEELHELAFVFRTLSEVVEKDYSDIRIRTISTSDMQVFIQCAVPVAAAAAIAIERIVALYKNALEIRKLRRELAKHKVPKDILQSLKTHLDDRIEKHIKEIAEEVVDRYASQHDEGRRNELRTSTITAVRYVAQRVRIGFVFEARVGKPQPEPAASPSPTPTPLSHVPLSEWARLNAAGRAMVEIEAFKSEIRLLGVSTEQNPSTDTTDVDDEE